ncbi:MAG: molybdopterin-dependent oxidoreductase [Methanoregulaceae archaeon]
MKPVRVLFVILLAVVGALYLVTLLNPVPEYSVPPGDNGNNPATALPSVEIQEYNGQKLTSSGSFPENSIKGPQLVRLEGYRLRVSGLVNESREYTYDEIIEGHPHYTKLVTLHCVEGWDATALWEGVLVRDILNETGIGPGATTIIFHAYDGYTTSFPVSYVTDNGIIMAYRINNATLPTARGFPFALVAENKWGYKWIRWIDGIELSDDTNYRGYWEQRGYSNSGNLNSSFFG